MYPIRHLCGQELERTSDWIGAYYAPVPISETRVNLIEVKRCPNCRETLCDTDMTDRGGVPLAVNNPSEWSTQRRAALAGLAARGYTLRYENSRWWIRATDRDYDTASSDNLDAVVELAAALSAGA